MSMDLVFSWLLTYWVHSTIALAGTWLVSTVLRKRNLALEESIWKAAMFLTLLTATLQVGLASVTPFRPLAGALEWASAAETSASSQVQVPATTGHQATSPRIAVSNGHVAEAPGAFVGSSRGSEAQVGAGDSGLELLSSGLDRALLVVLWLAAVSLLAVKLVMSYALFVARLRPRRLVHGGPFLALLTQLKVRAGVIRKVGLSVCERLSVPLALGFRRWEVCLPTRLTAEFSADEQETVLAHELAHLVRRDALWSLAARALAGAFFFQPLNFVARARLEALSELRCDDWAVAQTGRPVTLARCLTRVAAWRTDGWARSPAPAMAGASRSHFGNRVRRLLSRGYPLPPARVPSWLRLALAPMVVLFVAAAPAIVQRAHPAESETEIAGAVAAPLAEVAPPTESTALVAPVAPAAPVIPTAPVAPAAPLTTAAPGAGAPRSAPLSNPDPVAAPKAAPRPAAPVSPPKAAGRPEPSSQAVPAPAPEPAPEVSFKATVFGGHIASPAARSARGAGVGALDAEIEVLEEALESEFEAMEEELEAQMEGFEEQIEATSELAKESYEDGLEQDVERALGDLEALAVDMARRAEERNLESRRPLLEREIRQLEVELKGFRRQEERRLEVLARDLDRSTGHIWGRGVEHGIERAMRQQEDAIERRIEVAARELALSARALGASASDAQRDRLHAEALQKTRLMVPSEEELAKIRAGLERLRVELTPRMEDMDAARADFERALAEWRANYRVDLERLLEERRRSIKATQ